MSSHKCAQCVADTLCLLEVSYTGRCKHGMSFATSESVYWLVTESQISQACNTVVQRDNGCLIERREEDRIQ